MDNMVVVSIFAVGIFIGGLFAYLVARLKIRSAAEKGRMEEETERSILTERVRHREDQLEDLKSALEIANRDISSLRAEVRSESERRSKAEEKNTRIPELDAAITGKNKKIEELQSANADMKAKLAEILCPPCFAQKDKPCS